MHTRIAKARRLPTARTVALLAVLLSGSTAAWASEPLDIPPALERVIERRYPRDAADLKAVQSQVRRIAELAVPATVGVEVGRNIGSGVIINPEGLVLTAAHVIERSRRNATIVLPDGRRLPARTLGANHDIDTGMVQIVDPPLDLPYLPAAESSSPALGDWVVATGQPGGPLLDRTPPVRLGRILFLNEDWVCSDCTLVGGDSGGPLMNIRGEVTGIHTSIGPDIVLNFHTPVSKVREHWQRLLAGEVWGRGVDESRRRRRARPLLGLAGRTRDNQCVVTQVFPGLPAAAADIQPGDVVLSVDGEAIASIDELISRVAAKRPGQKLKLALQRDEEPFEVEVELARSRGPLPGSPPAERNQE